jgi:hypothetical protein
MIEVMHEARHEARFMTKTVTSLKKNACITVKKLAIQFTFSWFPVVIIRVAEVLIINAAFSATRWVTFAWRGANCCRGRYQLGPLVVLQR